VCVCDVCITVFVCLIVIVECVSVYVFAVFMLVVCVLPDVII